MFYGYMECLQEVCKNTIEHINYSYESQKILLTLFLVVFFIYKCV